MKGCIIDISYDGGAYRMNYQNKEQEYLITSWPLQLHELKLDICRVLDQLFMEEKK